MLAAWRGSRARPKRASIRHGCDAATAGVSARPRRASGVPHRVVVPDRLARRAGAAVARVPGDLLPRAHDRRREREPLLAAAARSLRMPRSPIRRVARCCTTNALQRPASDSSSRRPTTPMSDWTAGACSARRTAADTAAPSRHARSTSRSARSPTQPLLLQGRDGFSQKGPKPRAGEPLLQRSRSLQCGRRCASTARPASTTGHGWLDHEWSSSVLDAQAAGWDWVGMNLDDGTALTAFRIRPRAPGPDIYTYASLRAPADPPRTWSGEAVRFEPVSIWRSPRTNATYPVAQRLRVGDRIFETRPLMNDQELDSRASTGAVYWEGASELLRSRSTRRPRLSRDDGRTSHRCGSDAPAQRN